MKRLKRIVLGIAVGFGLLYLLLVILLRQPNWGHFEPVAGPTAEAQRLRTHVTHLAETLNPRDIDHPDNLAAAADYIRQEWARYGVVVEEQPYTANGFATHNLIASFGPRTTKRLVVGAHYDACPMPGGNPGADDNASGTAGLIELGRLLKEHPPKTRVDLVAYNTEEPPHFRSPNMGSAVHATTLKEEGVELWGMISLEMIGFFEEQQWPNWLYASLYPDDGDYIAVVGRFEDASLARFVKSAFRASEKMKIYSFSGPSFVPEIGFSDQLYYWKQGYPAVMITDTAFMRNPNYHASTDTVETLNYEKMAEVVDGLYQVVQAGPKAIH